MCVCVCCCCDWEGEVEDDGSDYRVAGMLKKNSGVTMIVATTPRVEIHSVQRSVRDRRRGDHLLVLSSHQRQGVVPP